MMFSGTLNKKTANKKEDPDDKGVQKDLKFREGDISWSSSLYEMQCRALAENIIIFPGPS